MPYDQYVLHVSCATNISSRPQLVLFFAIGCAGVSMDKNVNVFMSKEGKQAQAAHKLMFVWVMASSQEDKYAAS